MPCEISSDESITKPGHPTCMMSAYGEVLCCCKHPISWEPASASNLSQTWKSAFPATSLLYALFKVLSPQHCDAAGGGQACTPRVVSGEGGVTCGEKQGTTPIQPQGVFRSTFHAHTFPDKSRLHLVFCIIMGEVEEKGSFKEKSQ